MIGCSYDVTNLISKLPKYVDYENNLSSALTKILKVSLKKIALPQKGKTVKDLMNKRNPFKHTSPFGRLKISDIIKNENCCVMAYPESDINEVYSIMKNLGLKIVPVVKNPWNKKLMGFINKHQLEKEIKKVGVV